MFPMVIYCVIHIWDVLQSLQVYILVAKHVQSVLPDMAEVLQLTVKHNTNDQVLIIIIKTRSFLLHLSASNTSRSWGQQCSSVIVSYYRCLVIHISEVIVFCACNAFWPSIMIDWYSVAHLSIRVMNALRSACTVNISTIQQRREL